MNNFIILPIIVQERTYQDTITIQIGIDTIEKWYRALESLHKDITNSITISASQGSFKLRLSKDSTLQPSYRGKIVRKSSGIDLFVSNAELDMWLNFFSKFYFEGIGDVDHIDIDINPDSRDDEKGVFLVMKIPNAKASVSPEEAKRRLGLM
jgi:hypothetical protein